MPAQALSLKIYHRLGISCSLDIAASLKYVYIVPLKYADCLVGESTCHLAGNRMDSWTPIGVCPPLVFWSVHLYTHTVVHCFNYSIQGADTGVSLRPVYILSLRSARAIHTKILSQKNSSKIFALQTSETKQRYNQAVSHWFQNNVPYKSQPVSRYSLKVRESLIPLTWEAVDL